MHESWREFAAHHPDARGPTQRDGLPDIAGLGTRAYLTIGKKTWNISKIGSRPCLRGWGICCAGRTVYAARHREQWFSEGAQAGVRRRAQLFYQRAG